MRAMFCVSLAALSACASTGTTTSGPASQSIAVDGMPGRLTMSPTSSANSTSITGSLEQVWRALPAAFDSVGIPVTQVDPVRHIIGNPGFKLRQRLGKVSLSRYIDCGTTQVGPNADSYDVYVTALIQLQPGSGGTTTVTTTFEALARPIAFSQDYSRCSSRGSIETRLLAAVKSQLAVK